jgi:uncharacterized protein YbbK (DUF523 family)
MVGKPAFGQLNGLILMSACLLTIECRYDGKSKFKQEILTLCGLLSVPRGSTALLGWQRCVLRSSRSGLHPVMRIAYG